MYTCGNCKKTHLLASEARLCYAESAVAGGMMPTTAENIYDTELDAKPLQERLADYAGDRPEKDASVTRIHAAVEDKPWTPSETGTTVVFSEAVKPEPLGFKDGFYILGNKEGETPTVYKVVQSLSTTSTPRN